MQSAIPRPLVGALVLLLLAACGGNGSTPTAEPTGKPTAVSALLPTPTPDPDVLWTRQFGTPNDDIAFYAAPDDAGGLSVVGTTQGAFPGQTSSGQPDTYMRKYDGNGNELWTQQAGLGPFSLDFSRAVDGAGNSYVVSNARDTASGNSDAVVSKYDRDGNELWARQFGSTDFDFTHAVALDAAGNPYVVGWTWGALPRQTHSGASDVFLRKYDSEGNVLWTRQFGTADFDFAQAIAVDGAGNAYLVGWTAGAFPQQTNSGKGDVFARKYDSEGNMLWTRQFGSRENEIAFNVAVDDAGFLYVVGSTEGALPGQARSGQVDSFVRKYARLGAP